MKFFVCVNDDGCRLTDLNLMLVKDQVFKRDDDVVQKSRSIRAAQNAKWVEEISETKYNKLNRRNG